MKHVGKEVVGVVLVRFEGVAEMIGDAELMGGIECPLTSTWEAIVTDDSQMVFLQVEVSALVLIV